MLTDMLGIGIDWGSSNIRAWLLRGDGKPLAEGRLATGLKDARARGFEHVLKDVLKLLHDTNGLPAVACGMVGARDGWMEIPYLPCPTDPKAILAGIRAVPRQALSIIPGLAQHRPNADVMRGEETQLLGILTKHEGGTICLPGTHSKWVRIKDGQVSGFRTHATGDTFAALRSASICAALTEPSPFDPQAYREGIHHAAREPLTSALFQARSRVVMGHMQPGEAYWFLSGLLIGAELTSELESATQPIRLFADGALHDLYRLAFDTLDCGIDSASADDMTCLGLAHALHHLRGQ